MNLYQIMTNHYAPKDSHKAIWCYLIASSNEEVYEWLKSEPKLDEELGRLFLCWADWEIDDDEGITGEVSFKQQMIKLQDEEETDKADYDDLFYGKTFVSWKKLCVNIGKTEVRILKEVGVRIFTVDNNN